MTTTQAHELSKINLEIEETNDDKKLYLSIVSALVQTSGYATKADTLKKKADELFYGVKQKPFNY